MRTDVIIKDVEIDLPNCPYKSVIETGTCRKGDMIRYSGHKYGRVLGKVVSGPKDVLGHIVVVFVDVMSGGAYENWVPPEEVQECRSGVMSDRPRYINWALSPEFFNTPLEMAREAPRHYVAELMAGKPDERKRGGADA